MKDGGSRGPAEEGKEMLIVTKCLRSTWKVKDHVCTIIGMMTFKKHIDDLVSA